MRLYWKTIAIGLLAAWASWSSLILGQGGPLQLFKCVVLVASLLFTYTGIRKTINPTYSLFGEKTARGVAPSISLPTEPSDFRTMILYYGRNETNLDDREDFKKEIARQTQRENARKKHFASIAIASVRDNTKVFVQLHAVSPENELIWKGFVGEIPPVTVPHEADNPVLYITATDDLVRGVVEMALT